MFDSRKFTRPLQVFFGRQDAKCLDCKSFLRFDDLAADYALCENCRPKLNDLSPDAFFHVWLVAEQWYRHKGTQYERHFKSPEWHCPNRWGQLEDAVRCLFGDKPFSAKRWKMLRNWLRSNYKWDDVLCASIADVIEWVRAAAETKRMGKDATAATLDEDESEGDGGELDDSGATEDKDRRDKLGGMARAHRTAYLSYCYAMAKCRDFQNRQVEGQRVFDWEVYDWLEANEFDERDLDLKDEHQRELASYKLPSLDSWKSYVRKGRAVFNEQKNVRRDDPLANEDLKRRNEI